MPSTGGQGIKKGHYSSSTSSIVPSKSTSSVVGQRSSLSWICANSITEVFCRFAFLFLRRYIIRTKKVIRAPNTINPIMGPIAASWDLTIVGVDSKSSRRNSQCGPVYLGGHLHAGKLHRQSNSGLSWVIKQLPNRHRAHFTQHHVNLHSTVLAIRRTNAIIHTENKAFKSAIDTVVRFW